jgi:hypothetical protein
MKNKFIYLVLLSTLGFLSSCSKSNPPVTPEKPIVTVPVPPPPTTTPPVTTPPTGVPPTSTTKLLPIKIESPNQSVLFKYLGDTNSLLSVENSTGKKIIITYKDNHMNTLYTYEGNKTFYVDFVRDHNHRVNKVNQWSQTTDNDIPLGYYTITYNEQQQMTEINYFSPKNVPISTKTLAYDSTNNQMGIIIETKGTTETTKYTFDLKNGLFKNVANAQLIAMETGENFLLSADHNLLSMKSSNPKNDLTCSYEYNVDAYPTLINWEAPNVKMTFKVSYKTL